MLDDAITTYLARAHITILKPQHDDNMARGYDAMATSRARCKMRRAFSPAHISAFALRRTSYFTPVTYRRHAFPIITPTASILAMRDIHAAIDALDKYMMMREHRS